MTVSELENLLHEAGVDAYTHPKGYSGEDWKAYRERIATYLIKHIDRELILKHLDEITK